MKNYLKKNYPIIIILIVAAVLRLFNIGFQEPWLDELSTMQVSDPEISFSETHTLIMTREGFPHLYFLSLKYLSAIFGHSILLLRLFSAVSGIATIYFVFRFAEELFNKRAGYIAAILLTVNFFHIVHSQEARTYAFIVFFVTLASYLMVRYVKDSTMKNAIFMGIACGLIPNAHPLAVLNIGVIYGALLVFFLIEKDKKNIFRQLLVSVIFTLLFFAPAYQIIVRVSKIKSFWVEPASLKIISSAFFELLGNLTIGFYAYLISVVLFVCILIYKIVKIKDTGDKKLKIIAISLVSFWLIINIGVIIAKSYIGISIILSRYFIGSLVMFITTLAYCLSIIENKYLRNSLLSVFAIISLKYIYDRKYYTTVTKSEWQSLADEIAKKNVDKDNIYGPYAYVSNILFKKTPSYPLLKERKLDDYLRMNKNNSIDKESFWYMDGNLRPYSLTDEDQQYLNENYTMDIKIDKFDCWARHYTLKNLGEPQDGDEIFVKSFDPKVLDDEGRLYMFNNETISTKKLYLKQGKYEFTLEANSLPAIPIKNENAHIVLKLNDKVVGADFLSEKIQNKLKKFTFKVTDDTPKTLSITFDNDIATGDLDRNVIIYFVKLKRIEK